MIGGPLNLGSLNFWIFRPLLIVESPRGLSPRAIRQSRAIGGLENAVSPLSIYIRKAAVARPLRLLSCFLSCFVFLLKYQVKSSKPRKFTSLKFYNLIWIAFETSKANTTRKFSGTRVAKQFTERSTAVRKIAPTLRASRIKVQAKIG